MTSWEATGHGRQKRLCPNTKIGDTAWWKVKWWRGAGMKTNIQTESGGPGLADEGSGLGW